MRDYDYGYERRGISALAAALIGAAVGALVVYFSQEDNRKKVEEVIDETKERGEEKLAEVKEKAEEFKEKGRKKAIAGLERAQRKLNA